MWLLLSLCQAVAETTRGVEMGLGVRQIYSENVSINGIRALVRYRHGALSLGGDVYGSPLPVHANGYQRVIGDLIDVSTVRVPIAMDRFAAGTTLGVHLWPDGGQGVSPVVYLGGQVRQRDRGWFVQADGQSERYEQRRDVLAYGPTLGVGLEAEMGFLGARVMLVSRWDVSPEADMPQDVIVNFDFFYRFHAGGEQ